MLPRTCFSRPSTSLFAPWKSTRLSMANSARHVTKSASPRQIWICFPYFQQSGSRLALQLDITLETIPLLRHTTTPPLNAISRLLTVFRTPQKRLMSSGQPSPGPPFLRPWPAWTGSVCPSARSVLRFHAKGYDGDQYASRNGTASPARWKRTPRHTRNITPEPPAERHKHQVGTAGLADR